MADPYSLVGSPPPTSESQPDAQAMAPPSIFDRFWNRGSYMTTFSKERKKIVEEMLKEKAQLREQFRRDRKKYMERLKRGDREMWQKFDVPAAQRPAKGPLTDRAQKRLFDKGVKKFEKEMRLQERGALRSAERSRDTKIRTMRDNLRGGMYNKSA